MRNTFYGFKNRDSEKLNSDLVTFKFERDFNDKLSMRDQLRFGRSTRDSIATPPRFNNDNSTAINRELRSWLTEDRIWDNQTDLNARFQTGKSRARLVGGLNLTHENNIRHYAPLRIRSPRASPQSERRYSAQLRQPHRRRCNRKSLALYCSTRRSSTRNGNNWRAALGTTSGWRVWTRPMSSYSRIGRLLSGRLAVIYSP